MTSDINALTLYFTEGADLSSFNWTSTYFYEFWLALEGQPIPERTACATSRNQALDSILRVIQDGTAEWSGFNYDYYLLFLKIKGTPIENPVFSNNYIKLLYDAWSTSPSVYTPLDDPELFAWFNAQANITPLAGEVLAWESVNSPLITANPPTVTSRPLYATEQINGLDVLTFRSSDPNYINVDASSLLTPVNITLLVNNYINESGVIIASSASSTQRIRVQSGATNISVQGMGNNINFRKNGSYIGNNITRGELFDLIYNNNCVLTLQNVDLTVVTLLQFFINSSILPLSAYLGDIIISKSNDNLENNENYLINKYGL